VRGGGRERAKQRVGFNEGKLFEVLSQ